VEPRFLTLTEAADRLGLTFNQVRRRVEFGTLPAVKIGRAWRVPVSALADELVAQEEVGELDDPHGAAAPSVESKIHDDSHRIADAPTAGALLSSGEVAALAGVTLNTVGRWAREGRLVPALRTVGGHRRYRLDDVQAFLDDRVRPPA
jgi:excisionase family DNA binding protein